MIILGIETSCDETAAAIVENGRTVHASIVASQIPIHQRYGGVVPELASREHLKTINAVIERALAIGGRPLAHVSAVAVSIGPGLVGCLLTGVTTAKALAYASGIPWVGVNHLEGHLYAAFLGEEPPSFPFLGLVVSGGHTSILWARAAGDYEILGATRDDAAGEAFDKVSQLLGLGYPGGPAIGEAAVQGDPKAFAFPQARMKDGSMDLSFSGIKTAVLIQVKRLGPRRLPVHDLAASFQEAVVGALTHRVRQAAALKHARQVVVAGGVAANRRLREALGAASRKEGWRLFLPELKYCTDNAAMIGAAGYYSLKRGERSGWDATAAPGLKLV